MKKHSNEDDRSLRKTLLRRMRLTLPTYNWILMNIIRYTNCKNILPSLIYYCGVCGTKLDGTSTPKSLEEPAACELMDSAGSASFRGTAGDQQGPPSLSSPPSPLRTDDDVANNPTQVETAGDDVSNNLTQVETADDVANNPTQVETGGPHNPPDCGQQGSPSLSSPPSPLQEAPPQEEKGKGFLPQRWRAWRHHSCR